MTKLEFCKVALIHFFRSVKPPQGLCLWNPWDCLPQRNCFLKYKMALNDDFNCEMLHYSLQPGPSNFKFLLSLRECKFPNYWRLSWTWNPRKDLPRAVGMWQELPIITIFYRFGHLRCGGARVASRNQLHPTFWNYIGGLAALQAPSGSSPQTLNHRSN